ncbi:MAG: hypothetical protein Q8S21_05600 [Candidatus Paracaedibacteraceae bacterium]|nr:hypothetical protein [Candidatus Paracaedibacteraceae bacterium]
MSFIIKTGLRMLLMIAVICVSSATVHKQLSHIFSQNYQLNSIILGFFIFGILWCFHLMFGLWQEQKWLNRLDLGRERFPGTPKVKVLAPIAILMNEERTLTSLSPIAAKSILSSVESRLDESRDISRYIIGLLVFLGLLGTFWGLSETVGSIAGVIGGIDIQGENSFQTMKQGLMGPLGGMGTAFSCSMFGLAGSLVVGFLDLQVGRSFSTFYQQLEDRLACSTRYSTDIGDVLGSSGPAFSQGLLEQTIEGLSSMYQQMKRTEDTRLTMAKSVQIFSEKLSEMSEHMIVHQSFSQRLAQNQIELQELLINYTKDGAQGRNDEIVKTHLRSLDATLAKMLEELVDGRAHTTQEIRNEIRIVSKTLSAIANNGHEPG